MTDAERSCAICGCGTQETSYPCAKIAHADARVRTPDELHDAALAQDIVRLKRRADAAEAEARRLREALKWVLTASGMWCVAARKPKQCGTCPLCEARALLTPTSPGAAAQEGKPEMLTCPTCGVTSEGGLAHRQEGKP